MDYLPGKEDFGLTVVEAQHYGKPVLAYRAGGAVETIVEGKTGLFFDQQTVESLVQKLDILYISAIIKETVLDKQRNLILEHFNLSS